MSGTPSTSSNSPGNAREYGRYPDVGLQRLHWFTDPISGRDLLLNIGDEHSRPYDGTVGVSHTCTDQEVRLADVSPDLDAFYCSKCGLSGRISGAWFMDLWRAQEAQ